MTTPQPLWIVRVLHRVIPTYTTVSIKTLTSHRFTLFLLDKKGLKTRRRILVNVFTSSLICSLAWFLISGLTAGPEPKQITCQMCPSLSYAVFIIDLSISIHYRCRKLGRWLPSKGVEQDAVRWVATSEQDAATWVAFSDKLLVNCQISKQRAELFE